MKEMADTKFSQFSNAATLTGAEKFVGLQSGNNVQMELSTLVLAYINANTQLAAIGQVTGLTADLASKLSLSGGAMTGELILAGDPTFSLDAATMIYVDNTPGRLISGTTNQVNVGVDGFDVILSTPQDINTAAAVKFGTLGINLASTQSVNAALQIDSTTKGQLPARMTTAQMNAIAVTPADAGLMVYVTDLVDGYYYFDGEAWVYVDNNSGAGNTLQAAYDAGNTISLASSTPVIFSTQGALTNFAVFSNGGPATHSTDTLVGTQFTPTSNCFVTSLMYVDLYFASGQRQVGIYRVSDQALMVSDLVYKSDPLDSTTNYRVHAINSVPLQAGVTYIVLAIIPANESYVFYSNALVLTPGISNTGVTFGQIASTLVFPTTITTSANLVYGNGAFQFSASTSTLNVNDGTQNSLLTATSTVQGTIPFPPMSTTQFAAISQTKGLMGFDNVLNKITGYDGTVIQTVPWDSSVVHLAGTETITGAKTFSGTITGSISGNAGTATEVELTFTGANNTFYPALVSSSSTGDQSLDVSSAITFNPATGLNVLLAQIGAITSTTSANTVLNLFGPDSSNANAPAIGFFTNADGYPLMNLMPFSHGDSALSFDAYYTGSWLSSYTGSNFQIQSLGNKLNFNVSSGNAQGATISWTTGMFVDTSGHVNLPLLTASQAVVTDASKNLASLAYTNSNTVSTLVQRDSSGNFSAGTITAASVVAGGLISTTSLSYTLTDGDKIIFYNTPNDSKIDTSSGWNTNFRSGATGSANTGLFNWYISGASGWSSIMSLANNGNLSLSAGNLTATSFFSSATSGPAITLKNATSINGINSTAGTEVCLYPRFSDNKTYLDIGSGGFSARQNGGSSPWMTCDTGGNVVFLTGNLSVISANAQMGNLYNLSFFSGNIATKTGQVGPIATSGVTDMGMYAQGSGNFLRFGSNNALIGFWTDNNVANNNNPNAQIDSSGNFKLSNLGATVYIKEGVNGCAGTVTLSGSTTTVSTTSANTGDKIFMTVSAVGGTQGLLSYTISNSVSFTITSTTTTLDTSTIKWWIQKAA